MSKAYIFDGKTDDPKFEEVLFFYEELINQVYHQLSLKNLANLEVEPGQSKAKGLKLEEKKTETGIFSLKQFGNTGAAPMQMKEDKKKEQSDEESYSFSSNSNKGQTTRRQLNIPEKKEKTQLEVPKMIKGNDAIRSQVQETKRLDSLSTIKSKTSKKDLTSRSISVGRAKKK